MRGVSARIARKLAVGDHHQSLGPAKWIEFAEQIWVTHEQVGSMSNLPNEQI